MVPVVVPVALLFAAAPQSSPADEYRQFYTGSYAERGNCTDPGSVWILTDHAVETGAMRCLIRDVGRSGGALTVTLRSCLSAGEQAADRTIRVEMLSEETLRIRDEEGIHLVRQCPMF